MDKKHNMDPLSKAFPSYKPKLQARREDRLCLQSLHFFHHDFLQGGLSGKACPLGWVFSGTRSLVGRFVPICWALP